MAVPRKEFDITFSNANNRQASGLDHVIVSDGLQLTNQGNRLSDGQPFDVRVEGWQQLATQAQRNQFINIVWRSQRTQYATEEDWKRECRRYPGSGAEREVLIFERSTEGYCYPP